MRKHFLAAGAAADALGGRTHAQRPQVVLADHDLTARHANRKARVPVRRFLLPAGRAVRHRLAELAHLWSPLPDPRSRLDGAPRMVASVLPQFRAPADETPRLD